jgi:hypothetical protein
MRCRLVSPLQYAATPARAGVAVVVGGPFDTTSCGWTRGEKGPKTMADEKYAAGAIFDDEKIEL